MKRYPDWEQRLADYLDTVRYATHRYGGHDCAIHGANGVKAQTGKDFARGMRGKYRSAATASRFLRERGYQDLAALVTAKLGDPIPPALAQRGDLVMTDKSALGICMGPVGYFVGEEGGEPGLVTIARRYWTIAWRVPYV